MASQLQHESESSVPLERPADGDAQDAQDTDSTFPPSYAAALPSPDYSQAPLPSEEVVESSFHPPPYPLTRVGSNVPSVASSSRTRTSWLSDWLYEHSIGTATSVDSVSGEIPNEQAETASTAAMSARPSTASSSGTNTRISFISTIPPTIPETQERYRYHSGSIELDLGPRPDPDERSTSTSTFPTYGAGGTVKGTVSLKKMSHVQGVVVASAKTPPYDQIEGRVQTTIMQAGLASGHSAQKILDLSKVLYTPPATDASKTKGKLKEPPMSSFPFEFELPATADNSTDPLPPTFRGVHPAMEGSIKYIIKITVIKSGLWPRETCVLLPPNN
ncbi:hypothetical protein FRC17_001307 [Serendipita sp. 399]|nr:hypothetical protein FRC17_001307 [Serendipita sp. 399]